MVISGHILYRTRNIKGKLESQRKRFGLENEEKELAQKIQLEDLHTDRRNIFRASPLFSV